MKDFRDKVAVITGAASGIGRGLAEKCVQEGMKVVVADIETPALEQTEAHLRTKGGHVLAVQTDVSKENVQQRMEIILNEGTPELSKYFP